MPATRETARTASSCEDKRGTFGCRILAPHCVSFDRPTAALFDRLTAASLEQHYSRKPPEFCAAGLGREPADEVPQPREAHGALQAPRLFPHRAVLGLAPTVSLEERRSLGRRESEWRVARRHRLAPRLLHHLEQRGRPQVDQPPPK